MALRLLVQQAKVGKAVTILEERIPALIAALRNVMRHPRKYDASVTWHGRTVRPGQSLALSHS
jgi:hypothetical protein